MALSREFTVANFVVDQGRILLLWHRKLQMWLPPGGHIDPNELPDEAAVREVLEETGIVCKLFGDQPLADLPYPRQLIRPAGIQLESIMPNEHEHIDLIYFSLVEEGQSITPRPNDESEQLGWYSLAELRELQVAPDVYRWAELACQAYERLSRK